jgi:hypothetical protein
MSLTCRIRTLHAVPGAGFASVLTVKFVVLTAAGSI